MDDTAKEAFKNQVRTQVQELQAQKNQTISQNQARSEEKTTSYTPQYKDHLYTENIIGKTDNLKDKIQEKINHLKSQESELKKEKNILSRMLSNNISKEEVNNLQKLQDDFDKYTKEYDKIKSEVDTHKKSLRNKVEGNDFYTTYITQNNLQSHSTLSKDKFDRIVTDKINNSSHITNLDNEINIVKQSYNNLMQKMETISDKYFDLGKAKIVEETVKNQVAEKFTNLQSTLPKIDSKNIDTLKNKIKQEPDSDAKNKMLEILTQGKQAIQVIKNINFKDTEAVDQFNDNKDKLDQIYSLCNELSKNDRYKDASQTIIKQLTDTRNSLKEYNDALGNEKNATTAVETAEKEYVAAKNLYETQYQTFTKELETANKQLTSGDKNIVTDIQTTIKQESDRVVTQNLTDVVKHVNQQNENSFKGLKLDNIDKKTNPTRIMPEGHVKDSTTIQKR